MMKTLGVVMSCAWMRAGGMPVELEEPLVVDSECDTQEEGSCGLNALQVRMDIDSKAATPEVPRVWNNTWLQEFHADLAYDADLDSRVASCQEMFGQLIRDGWDIAFFEANYAAETVESISWSGASGALARFMDPKTDNVQITWPKAQDRCVGERSQIAWFYPKADHNGAFNLNNFVCERLGIFVSDRWTTCLNVYRVSSVQEIDHILDKWTPAGSLAHAVLGGHGSDDVHGVLYMGNDGGDASGQIQEGYATHYMLAKLRNSLTTYGTVFLDSCFSAKNGLAKFVSERIPLSWIFGGVVSLDSSILLVNTAYPGGSPDGPPRVVTDPENGKERIKMFHNGQDWGFITRYL